MVGVLVAGEVFVVGDIKIVVAWGPSMEPSRPVHLFFVATDRRLTMPRGDGTGPPKGSGQGTGRGAGMGGNRRGRMGGSRAGAGPGGECVCPKCGTTVPHDVGKPCYFVKCPKCGSTMVRK